MEAAQACLRLHLSKCNIVGNHMSRLIMLKLTAKETIMILHTKYLLIWMECMVPFITLDSQVAGGSQW